MPEDSRLYRSETVKFMTNRVFGHINFITFYTLILCVHHLSIVLDGMGCIKELIENLLGLSLNLESERFYNFTNLTGGTYNICHYCVDTVAISLYTNIYWL